MSPFGHASTAPTRTSPTSDLLVRNGTTRDPAAFDAALAGRCDRLITTDGLVLPLAPERWHAEADADDHWMLERCTGPTIDLGCGPGRLVVALAARGVPTLGVDVSGAAVARCRARGASVLHRDALGPLPHEGRWAHIVLADGNIGIGGNPAGLLRRCYSLLSAEGSVIAELQSEGGLWQGLAHLHGRNDPHAGRGDNDGGAAMHPGPWFPWAVVGIDAIDEVAAQAGLSVVDRTRHRRSRCFAELAPR